MWCCIRDCFTFALRHTPAAHIGNVRRILINLVPVQVTPPDLI